MVKRLLDMCAAFQALATIITASLGSVQRDGARFQQSIRMTAIRRDSPTIAWLWQDSVFVVAVIRQILWPVDYVIAKGRF
jgi:hypothetical protein